MLRVSITVTHHDPGTYDHIEQVVGHRLYVQGTDQQIYADYTRREFADLDVANLNQIPGVKAKLEQYGV